MRRTISVLFCALAVGGLLAITGIAYASTTPTLTLTNEGDGDSVQISVTADPSTSILLDYYKTNAGQQITPIGTTDTTGALSVTVSSSAYGIASGSPVYVIAGGLTSTLKSATESWPNVTTSSNLSLSPTSLALSIGQSATITATNPSGNAIYLSNNTNPPVANINISGNQITVNALSNGSATANLCLISSAGGSSSTCASFYILVSSTAAQPLSFSISTVTVSPGQSVPITISGGTGSYSIVNNSNSTAIQTNISGSTITLSTNATTGSSSITVCSTDMSACGVINATAGAASSTPLAFTPASVTVAAGQSTSVIISGGTTSDTYYVASSTNTSVASTNLGGNALTVSGITNGTATLTICSASGNCGTVPVTVTSASSGGTVQLSQSTLTLLVGQVYNITISGGTPPYNVPSNPGTIAQTSINGNILTVSGIGVGSTNINVCTSGSACTTLSATVNNSGSNSPVSFSQNNLAVNVGGTAVVTLSGSGGYYVSTNANSNVATVQVSGNIAIITGSGTGNDTISVCASNTQCAILSVSVQNSSTAQSMPLFSQTNPTITVGQALPITLSSGTGSNYYVSANSNPTAVAVSISGSTLTVTGQSAGSSSIVVCASSSSCSVLNVSVNSAPSTASIITITSASSLPSGIAGTAYSDQLVASGGTGSYTFSLSASSGALPQGIALSSNGMLSGTPGNAATATITVSVTDTNNNTTSKTFTLTVNPASTTTPAGTSTNSSSSSSSTAPTSTPTSSSAYPTGELINENGTIYMVYQNTKVGFTNPAAFLGLGFDFAHVVSVSNSGLALADKTVVTADGMHPRGTWVLFGNTVFLVTPSGLIPVPSWSIFINNGGQAQFIVPGNTYDQSLPTLSVMTMNDPRI